MDTDQRLRQYRASDPCIRYISFPHKLGQEPRTVHECVEDVLSKTVIQKPLLAGTPAVREPDRRDSRCGRLEILVSALVSDNALPLRFQELTATLIYNELVADD
ncbi:hypothetical protein N7G274_003396 [Stereocaulon virgatum]|uniref:Uncharacterized protein n=1 Tax=Stereocaulon virgatum TaxID=373712 RepID=A0ABR4AGC5_9LECA